MWQEEAGQGATANEVEKWAEAENEGAGGASKDNP